MVKRYIVTNQGMMRGYWKVWDTLKKETVFTTQTMKVAELEATRLNKRGRRGVSGSRG
jgi:hypothetical protein